ncbi:hypothetical protein AVEN_221604-1, partial [Araneus ventricosus]
VYEYLANLATAFALATPFYLLLEAPLSNIERLLNTRPNKNEETQEKSIKMQLVAYSTTSTVNRIT